mmetsp:Transcript_77726/g.237828  ORF Transcript_77726/g.237828 Transcript_77726/m.237828 type:complete len:219 (+) Transcript_77726:663-1319(+)
MPMGFIAPMQPPMQPPMPAPPAAGDGPPHRRQDVLRANCKSPQAGQIQSPGFPPIVVGSTVGAAFQASCLCAAKPLPPIAAMPPPLAGLAAPHFRHVSFLANWWSPQLGHDQSPGLKSPPPTPPTPMHGAGALSKPPPAPCGLGVPHFRHEAFRPNCKSLQLGQCQSPGRAPSPPTAAPAAPELPFGAPHFRQELFRANWWSPQAAQFQSPGCMAAIG